MKITPFTIQTMAQAVASLSEPFAMEFIGGGKVLARVPSTITADGGVIRFARAQAVADASGMWESWRLVAGSQVIAEGAAGDGLTLDKPDIIRGGIVIVTSWELTCG